MISPFEFKTTQKILVAFALIAAFVCQPGIVSGQGKVADGESAKAKYEAALLEGRELVKACRNVSLRFFDSSRADSRKWEKKWPVATKALADHKVVFEEAAVNWFMECKQPDNELIQVVSLISSQFYDDGDAERSWKLLRKIRQYFPGGDSTMLDLQIAIVAAKTNRFDEALAFLQRPDAREAIEELEPLEKSMLLLAPLMAEKWERESQLREAEAKADDLPRVKFELEAGEVIVELFENEAPQTVANFLSRVESGLYDGSYCHPHIKDIVMQSGLVSREREIPADYLIKNESRREDSRSHFAGSLTMASLKGGKETSSTGFAIMMAANPDLDWNRTEEDDASQPVFGRVVSGMKYVAGLPVTMEIDPETNEQSLIKESVPGYIERATVIRKRNHEYTFEKIQSQ